MIGPHECKENRRRTYAPRWHACTCRRRPIGDARCSLAPQPRAALERTALRLPLPGGVLALHAPSLDTDRKRTPRSPPGVIVNGRGGPRRVGTPARTLLTIGGGAASQGVATTVLGRSLGLRSVRVLEGVWSRGAADGATDHILDIRLALSSCIPLTRKPLKTSPAYGPLSGGVFYCGTVVSSVAFELSGRQLREGFRFRR